MTQTPKTIRELAAQLVEYENTIKQLNKKNKALQMMLDNGRQKAVIMHARSTKKSSFTNYEVKQMSKDVLDALQKKPLLK